MSNPILVALDLDTVAAASAIDPVVWRDTGTIVLDPAAAAERALASLDGQVLADEVTLPAGWLAVSPEEVSVTVEAEIDLTLLRLAHPDPVTVTVTGRAIPSLRD